MIERDANIDIDNENGNTPLMVATSPFNSGSIEAFQILLENGAEISTRNSEQHTVLMIAAARGKGAVIECLLRCKSDSYINEVEEIGDSIELAIKRLYDRKAKLKPLLDFCSNNNPGDGRYDAALSSALSLAKSRSRPDFVSLLLEHGAVDLDPGDTVETAHTV